MGKGTKKTELINGLKDQNWVEKSDPLLIMKEIPFSLGELKLLDIYLSRINAADPSTRTVVFSKQEYEDLMGLKDSDGRTLDRNTDKLLTKMVKLKVGSYFDKFTLFDRASYKEDEHGKKVVTIKCSESAQDFFFCLQKYHYNGYELKNVLSLNSIHSYLLYLHVRTNRYKGSWTVQLEQLRDEILDLEGSYQEFKVFKRDVLLPAVKEINEKTDCRVEIEALRHGRAVRSIKFTYIPADSIPLQVSLFDGSTETETTEEMNDRDEQLLKIYGSDDMVELAKACDLAFTGPEMDLIFDVLLRKPIKKDPVTDTMLYGRFFWLREKYSALKVAEDKKKLNGEKPVKDRFKYFLKMIEEA